jgi:hypothetical protein
MRAMLIHNINYNVFEHITVILNSRKQAKAYIKYYFGLHSKYKSMDFSSSIKNLIDEKAESGQRRARIHHFLLVSFLLYGFLKKLATE